MKQDRNLPHHFLWEHVKRLRCCGDLKLNNINNVKIFFSRTFGRILLKPDTCNSSNATAAPPVPPAAVSAIPSSSVSCPSLALDYPCCDIVEQGGGAMLPAAAAVRREPRRVPFVQSTGRQGKYKSVNNGPPETKKYRPHSALANANKCPSLELRRAAAKEVETRQPTEQLVFCTN